MGRVWPEKIALASAALVMVGMFLFWALLADGARSTHDTRLNAAAVHWFVQTEIMLILPLWLLLRAVYLATRYWRRRRSQ